MRLPNVKTLHDVLLQAEEWVHQQSKCKSTYTKLRLNGTELIYSIHKPGGEMGAEVSYTELHDGNTPRAAITMALYVEIHSEPTEEA